VCLGKWNSALVALKFCRKKGNLEDFMREAQIMMYERECMTLRTKK
jgi:hypothetical protein